MSTPNAQVVAPQVRDSKLSTIAPSGTTMTVTLPSLVSGDLLLIGVCTTATVATPSGYSLVDSQTGSDAKLSVFSKTATGSEGASLAVTIGSNNQTVATAVSIIGGSIGTTVHTESSNGSSLTLNATTTIIESLVVAFQGAADGTGQACTPPGSFTELQDGKAQFDFRQSSLSYITAASTGSYGGTFGVAPSGALSLVLVPITPTRTSPVSATQVVSTGVQAVQLGGVASSQLGAASGVATLDSTKNVPGAQLANSPPLPATPAWETFQDPGVGGRVVKVLVSKYDSNRIYVSGDMLGIGVSFDGGQTFGGGFGLPSWEMGSFTEHPTNPLTVWCGSMSGLVKSIDGGINWTLKRSGFPNTAGGTYSAPVEKVLFDPTDPTHLLAFGGSWRIWKFFSGGGVASGGYGSVWESHNSGDSWTLKSTVSTNENIMWATGASDWSKIWVITQHNGVYISTDQGTTWSQSNTGLLHTAGSGLALDPNSSNQTLYCSLMASGTVTATLSGGLSTGSPITSIPLNAFASSAIPTGGTLPTGTVVSLSTSGHSQSWTVSSPLALGGTSVSVNSQTPNFAYPSGSSITAFLPGGVYKSTNAGATWALSGSGQPQAQSTSQSFCTWLDSVHLTTDGILYFGDQDTGNAVWDGTKSANDYMYKSVDSGATWTHSYLNTIQRFFPGPTNIHQFTDDPAVSGTVWGGTNDGLIYTTDAGVTWHDAGNLVTNTGALRGRGYSGILGYRVAFNRWRKGFVILNGSDSGQAMMTKDGGQSWSNPIWQYDFFFGAYDTTIGGPTGNVTYILLGQGFQGDFNGIAISQNAGVTWAFKSGSGVGLPSRGASGASGCQNGLVVGSADGSVCYAAWNGAVYKTANFGASWAQVGGNSHNVAVSPDYSTVYNTTITGGVQSAPTSTSVFTVMSGSPNLSRMVVDQNNGDLWGVGYHGRFSAASVGVYHYSQARSQWSNPYNNGDGGCEDIAVDPFDSNHIVVANDQNPFNDISTAKGVLESKDGGVTWKTQNNGLRMTRVMSIAFDPWEAGRVVCGTDGGGYFTTKMYGTATPIPKGLHSGVAGVTDVPNLELRLRKLQNELDTFIASTTNLNGVFVTGAAPLNGQTLTASSAIAASWATPVPFDLQGAWINSNTYDQNDYVGRLGGSYVCLTNGTTTDPSVDSTNWMQVTAPGANFTQNKTFYRIGANNHSVGATTTLAITVPSYGHLAGNLFQIVAVTSSATIALSSVTESPNRSNVYTVIANGVSGTGATTYLIRSPLTTSLVSGDTITLTFASSLNTIIMDSAEFLNVSAVDVSGTNGITVAANQQAATSGALTPGLAGELAIAVMGYAGTVGGTWNTNGTTGFTLLNDFTNTITGQTRRLSWAYSTRGDTSAVTPIWTLGGANTSTAGGIAAIFK